MGTRSWIKGKRTQAVAVGILVLIILVGGATAGCTTDTESIVESIDRNTTAVGELRGDVTRLGDRVTTLEGKTEVLGTKEVAAKVTAADLEPFILRIEATNKGDREQLILDMQENLPEAIIAALASGGYIPSASATIPTPTATVTPTATPTETPAPVATRVPTTGIPKETIYTLRIEQERDGEKVLAILSNLRNPFEDPGCPTGALVQPAVKTGELRRCLTTKTHTIEWLGVSALPMAGREWLVLDQTIFPVANMEEKPLGRQPAFWYTITPSAGTQQDRLLVTLKAGASSSSPQGKQYGATFYELSKDEYVAWVQPWTPGLVPSHLQGAIYAVYPFLTEQ